MLDHFDYLAPLYEKLMPASDPELLLRLLAPPADGNLLDAAGGTGRASESLRGSAKRIVVCDSSGAMLQVASAKGMETTRANVESLPFANDSFDSILLVDAFHHLRDQKVAIRELLRVLKLSGRLLIEEPDCTRLRVKCAAFLEKLFMMRSNFYLPETMIRMITDLGGCAHLAHKDNFRVWIVVSKQQSSEENGK